MHPEEAAFQAALDAHPADHTTRLVFADWLQERGDPRAEGYRALGMLGIRPRTAESDTWRLYWYKTPVLTDPSSNLPLREWVMAMSGYRAEKYRDSHQWGCADQPTREECENDAAHAFLLLPRERRAELLTPAVPASG